MIESTDQLEQIARDVAGSTNPVEALRKALTDLSAGGAVHVAESVFNRLPVYSDQALLRRIAAAYSVTGETVAATLVAGMADQMVRFKMKPDRSPETRDDDDEVREILAAWEPAERLLESVAAVAQDPDRVVRLILLTWTRLPPVLTFWLPYQALRAFESMGHNAGTVVMAAFALQLAPTELRANEPAHYLVGNLLGRKRLAAAAALAIEWGARTGAVGVLADGISMSRHIVPLPPAAVTSRVQLLASERVAPAPVSISSAHVRFRELAEPLTRDPIDLFHFKNVEVVVAKDHVGIVHEGGRPDNEIWVGLPPTLIAILGGDAPTIQRERVIVISDPVPAPNLSHGLTDHAPRLALYRRGGIDLDRVSLIGPRPAQFQRDIIERFGVGEWIYTDQPRRVRVRSLWILSTCARVLHPAHYAAPWALDAIREAFDVADISKEVGRRLYISRADASRRRVINERALTDALQPLGFEVIVPGDLTISRQSALFAEASIVIGPHGAGLSNVVFCRAGTHFLELAHPNYAMLSFVMPAMTLSLNYQMIVGADGGPIETAPVNDLFSIQWQARDFSIDVEPVVTWATNAAKLSRRK